MNWGMQNKTGGTNRPAKRRVSRFVKKALPWLVITAIIIYAGAGFANTLFNSVTGIIYTKVRTPVIVDLTNLDAQDIGKAASRAFVAANRQGTEFSAAAELEVGEELVFDLPLLNRSNNDIELVASISNLPPAIMRHIEVFWDSLTRSSTPSVHALSPAVYPDLDPDPPPVTPTLPQGSDTQPSDTNPTGAAVPDWQNSDSTLSNIPPVGLPSNPTQTAAGTITNALPDYAPGTAPVITPRNADDNASLTNIQPDDLMSVTEQSRSVGSGALTIPGALDGTGENTTSGVDWAGDVGEYTSIAALDADNIFVSYYDATSGDLNFAKSTDGGSNWAISAVEQSQIVTVELAPGDNVTMTIEENATVQSLATSGQAVLYVWPDDPDYSHTTVVSTDPLYPTLEDFEKDTVIDIIEPTGVAGAVVQLSLKSITPQAVRVEIGDTNLIPTTATLPQYGDTVHLYGPPSSWPANLHDINVNLVSGAASVVNGIPAGALPAGTSLVSPDGSGDLVIQATSPNTVIEFWEDGVDYNYFIDLQNPVCQYTSIAAMSTDDLFISYYDPVNADLKFARSVNGGASWVLSTIDNTGGHDVGKYNSIAASGTGPYNVFISYYDIENNGTGDLKFAVSDDSGVSWTRTILDTWAGDTVDVGQYSSVAFAEPEEVFISYYDATSYNLKFIASTDNGTTWAAPYTVAPNPQVTIQLVANDTAVMEVVTASSTAPAVMEFVDVAGDSTVTLPNPPGGTQDISNDFRTPTTVIYTATGGQQIEAKAAGANVQLNLVSLPEGSVSIQIGDNQTMATSLYLGEINDTVTIHGPASQDIWARVTTGNATASPGPVLLIPSVWNTVTANATGDITITAGATNTKLEIATADINDVFMLEMPRTVDIGQHSSIDATDNNTLFISCYNESDGDLMFAGSDDGGATWSLANIDDPAAAGVPPDLTDPTEDNYDTGQYSSIDALITGDVFISYYDASNGSLKLAQSSDNGTTWTTSAIDAVGLVGSYTSVAAVSENITFISYRDIGDEDLMVFKPVNTRTWYPGIIPPDTFSVDINGDGTLDNLYFVLTDLASDGDIDLMELSSDNSSFGQADVADNIVTINNDEWFAAGSGNITSDDITLGGQLFTILFENMVDGGNANAYIISQTWYTGTFTIDIDADGAADDIFDFALSDTDSDGLYNVMDISTDNMTFGTGPLSGQVPRQTGYADDERIQATDVDKNVRLGDYYTFEVWFSDHPYTALPDATLESKTWLTAEYDIAADTDSVVNDRVYYVITDSDSDALYDLLDVSLAFDPLPPATVTFGEGALGDNTVNAGNDERIGASTALDYGVPPWSFVTDFDIHPGDIDGEDVFMTPQTRFIGQFVFDADANGIIDSPGDDDLFYVLSDTDGDGRYETMDISLGDEVYGDGLLTNEWVQLTNDERITASTTMYIGDTYAVQAEFVPDPLVHSVDARILLVSKAGTPVAFTSWTGWVIDADGDAVDGDWVHFVLTDAGSGNATPSDGVVDTIDISIGDHVYGETGNLTDGFVDFDDTNNTNDERVAFEDFPYLIQLGLHYFLVEADTAIYDDDDDARITSRWYVGTFPVDVDNDQVDNEIDFVQVDPYSYGLYTVFELDCDDSDSYEASEVYSNTGVTDHLWDVWGTSGSDVIAVGYGGRIIHYDGTQWGAMSSTVPNNLYGLWGSASDDVFAAGAFGAIVHYDGTSWIPMNSGNTSLLTDIWGSASDDVFAVGYDGTILHYDGAVWSPQVSGTASRLLGVWGSSSDNISAVGYDGTILHTTDGGANWNAQVSGTPNHLNDVWGVSSSDVYAVGNSGTILHTTDGGINWNSVAGGTTENLTGVWGTSPDDVYVVGYSGTILHYDGTEWATMESHTRHDLAAVWGAATDDIFAVGYVDMRQYYDGREWYSLSAGLLVDLNGHRIWLEYWANPAQTDSAVLTDGNILEICRRNASEWVFRIPSDPHHPEGTQSQIRIKIALPDDVSPGFYRPIITIDTLGL